MAFSSLSDPIANRLAHQLSTVSKRWNLQPVDIVDGTILWLGWTGLTWLAFLLSLLFVEIGEAGEVWWLEALAGGCLVGVCQWLVLRPYLRGSYRWIVATGVSWSVLGLLHLSTTGWVAPGTFNLLLRGIFGVLYGSYVGLGLGIGQWWVMRNQVTQAWRWIPLSAGIWAMSIAIAWIAGGLLRLVSGLFMGEVVGLVLGWGAIAALSGIGIVGLLYDQPSTLPALPPAEHWQH